MVMLQIQEPVPKHQSTSIRFQLAGLALCPGRASRVANTKEVSTGERLSSLAIVRVHPMRSCPIRHAQAWCLVLSVLQFILL